MGLEKYWQKRDFDITPEPRGSAKASGSELAFYIQKHHARRLHYDFRLELQGTLKSWAVPKGPSLDPKDKRLAVHVEDHPLEYGTFEGDIPAHQYGAGHVILWDQGVWEPIGDAVKGYREGSLKFHLHGEKLSGKWALVRMKGKDDGDKENWLLIKEKDEEARTGDEANITENMPDSVKVQTARSTNKTKTSRKKTIAQPLKKTAAASGNSLSKKLMKPMPASLKPQLATLAQRAPRGDEWLAELKFDGYRALAKLENGKAVIYSRNGNDVSKKWAVITEALAELPAEQAWLDGEVVAIRPDGTISFQELQNAMRLGKDVQLAYFIFDLLYLNGNDLTGLPLIQRKELLQALLAEVDKESPLHFSDHIEGQADEIFEHACMHSQEGIIVKRKDGLYHQYRSQDWLKVKCHQRQEFVIGGYTDPAGSRNGFGALLLGVYDDSGKLHYSGRVGTGFNAASLKAVAAHFSKLKSNQPAFAEPPKGQDARGVHWLKPELVAEVQFAAWTDSGVVRHASFLALRNDKPAEQIVHEIPLQPKQIESLERQTTEKNKKAESPVQKPATSSPPSTQRGNVKIAGVTLSNPAKVLFSGKGITKQGLAEYYAKVEKWILPHLHDRPLSIVRCPNGQDDQCFFQKHAAASMHADIERIEVPTSQKDANYMLANNLPALISLVQMGVLELHTWGASKHHLEQPDRLIFDLDPDEGLDWQAVTDAALLTRGLLEELGLRSFVKTTGGKGLHVVAPIVPDHDWDTIKQFTKGIAAHMSAQIPDRFTANMSKQKRSKKIFIDYLRNSLGATAIAAYSTRAKPNAPISVPIFWEEVGDEVRSDSFRVDNIMQRLSTLDEDPWKDYAKTRQRITSSMLKHFSH